MGASTLPHAEVEAAEKKHKVVQRIASMNKHISEYPAKPCRVNWESTCNDLQITMSARKSWCLLRHMIDPLNGMAATNLNLTNVLNAYGGDVKKVIEDMKAKYLKS